MRKASISRIGSSGLGRSYTRHRHPFRGTRVHLARQDHETRVMPQGRDGVGRCDMSDEKSNLSPVDDRFSLITFWAGRSLPPVSVVRSCFPKSLRADVPNARNGYTLCENGCAPQICRTILYAADMQPCWRTAPTLSGCQIQRRSGCSGEDPSAASAFTHTLGRKRRFKQRPLDIGKWREAEQTVILTSASFPDLHGTREERPVTSVFRTFRFLTGFSDTCGLPHAGHGRPN